MTTSPGGTAADSDERKQRLRRRLERLIGVAATEGNELVALRNGDEIFPAMLSAIRAARHTVDMMTFVYWRGRSPRNSPRRSPSVPVPGSASGCCSTVSVPGR